MDFHINSETKMKVNMMNIIEGSYFIYFLLDTSL